MKPVFVRLARPEEGQLHFQWASENPASDFDPQTALFPSSTNWCAYDKDGPRAFQTFQQPFMLESFSPRPGATALQNAEAMRELVQNAITQADLRGVGEIYLLASDSATAEFAANHIFTKLPYSVYRVKIKDLQQ